MTDLLGVMESWTPPTTSVRAEDGSLVEIPLADIVSGKPVPARPSVRLRASPEEAERRALSSWRPREHTALGDWVLRAAGGFTARANSVLAVGDPRVPLPQAVAVVRSYYAARKLPAWAQVVVGSEPEQGLIAAGWVPARPGEDDTVFAIAPVPQAVRALRPLLPEEPPPAEVAATLPAGWLADEPRAVAAGDAARAVLEGAGETGFVSVPDWSGTLLAKGRVALTSGVDPWAGISDLWVHPGHRRQGLGLVVMDELLTWAAERGASTVFLQVRGDNPEARALYARLGFVDHHRYRYLAAPA